MAKSNPELLDMAVKIVCETVEPFNIMALSDTKFINDIDRVSKYFEKVYGKLVELNK